MHNNSILLQVVLLKQPMHDDRLHVVKILVWHFCYEAMFNIGDMIS